MNKDDVEIINAVQAVLRHLMLSLAAASNADLAKIGQVLEAAATNTNLGPLAQSMLADLASGATAIGTPGQRKQ